MSSERGEKLRLRDKLFKKFKSNCLKNMDWKVCKEARNDVQGLIKHNNKKYFKQKNKQKI